MKPQVFIIAVMVAACRCVSTNVHAAIIPGLFNTGVDDQGVALKDNATELHYKLVTPSPVVNAPVVATSAGGFPIPPWLADNVKSAWITPASDANGPGLQDGSANYYYELSFDLTGFDSTTATISGAWSTDNQGIDILLNDASTGQTNPDQFGVMKSFVITNGFVAGKNVLTFVVNNGAGEADANGPTGLRVEMTGTVMAPGTPPTVTIQPRNQIVPPGDTVVFSVAAEGTAPLSYQWRFNGQNLSGFTNSTTAIPGLANIQTNQSGQYDVVVRNSAGSTNSVPALLTVLPSRIPGLFGTGVDNNGAVLNLEVDPHYQLVVNADSTNREAMVHDTTVFPIVTGPWVANSDISAWIAPRTVTQEAASGIYVYRTTFNLTGLDPASAVLLGQWAADNDGPQSATDILLNGVPLGFKSAPFTTLTDFVISNTPAANFFPGANTLEFRVENLGAGYTGLRVDNLRGGAKPGAATNRFALSLNFYSGLRLGGFVGSTYTIEYLDAKATNWLVLTNLVLPADPYFFVDPTGPNQSGRQYRAKLAP